MAFGPFRAAALRRLALLGLAALWLAGCQDSGIPKQLKPVPHALVAAMDQLNMKATSPIFIRLFKESSELEIWKETESGSFALLKTYKICKWSGALGPKKVEGDRQAPEGFYTVTPAQMNPNSSYYLSFNIGYPNTFDRSLGRTGSNLMLHGACSSSGCYSMTDEDAGEIFSLARDSFRGGQTAFQIQALPFRMTPENLARHHGDPNMEFWKMLKVGTDHFELTRRPPKVDVCEKHYVFDADGGAAIFSASEPCPPYTMPEALTTALARKQADDDASFTAAVARLDAEVQQEAENKQLAAAKALEQEQQAAERAAEPSLLTRLLGRADKESESAVTPAVALTQVPGKPAPKVIASVPVPRVRPVEKTPAETTVTAPAETPASQTASGNTITPQMTPDIPAVGKFVKKKFVWPGDDATGDSSGKTL